MAPAEISGKSKSATSLATVLARTRDTAESVYQSLDISQRFINGIADYARSKRAPGFEEAVVDEWKSFTNTYAIYIWESRDLIIGENFNIMNFQNIVPFLRNKDMPLEAKIAKVDAFMATPSESADKMDKLGGDLQGLQTSIKIWKLKLAGKIDALKVTDDGSSSYHLLIKDLHDLREHLMLDTKGKGDSWEELSNVWLLDQLSPMTTDMNKLAEGCRSVWADERTILNGLLTLVKSTIDILFESDVKDIEKAYKDLAAAAAVYDEKIYTDFYWRYEKAMKDAK